jgi:UDP-N-acetylglucosamine transferase subunit ALG13
MVLVLLGTQNNSFVRLLEQVENCINVGLIKEEVIVQAGYTNYHSNKMKILDFVSSSQLKELIDKADLIITHGGVGSIITSIKSGKKVIAVARLEKYKEHVNDHQLQIVKNFNDKDYIVGLEDACLLKKALENINSFVPKKYISNAQNILDIVSNYIDNN